MRFTNLLSIIAGSLMLGCSSIHVKTLDKGSPEGLPFYMPKPLVKVTATTYNFFKEGAITPFTSGTTVEKEIITVIDPSSAYTINHRRSFAGESTFKVEAANGAITSVESVNKEGLTEFLKGLVEGANNLEEVAREAAAVAKPAGAITDNESTYFQMLAQKNILVVKSVAISFETLP
jgi:hypothetical protein